MEKKKLLDVLWIIDEFSVRRAHGGGGKGGGNGYLMDICGEKNCLDVLWIIDEFSVRGRCQHPRRVDIC